MRAEVFDRVEVVRAAGSFRIEQRNCALACLPSLAVLGGLAIAVVAPQLALAGYALASDDFRSAMAERPEAALQIAVALLIWMALVCWPLWRRAAGLSRRRSIEISGQNLCVDDTWMFGDAHWSARVDDFSSIGFETRSTVSGVRRDFVLRRTSRGQSIVLAAGEQIDDPPLREAISALQAAAALRQARPQVSVPCSGAAVAYGISDAAVAA